MARPTTSELRLDRSLHLPSSNPKWWGTGREFGGSNNVAACFCLALGRHSFPLFGLILVKLRWLERNWKHRRVKSGRGEFSLVESNFRGSHTLTLDDWLWPTYFGHTICGQNQILPNHQLPVPSLAIPTELWPNQHIWLN